MNEIGVDIWRGGVSPWECDQMGHLNVSFYLTRASEALVGLAAELGLPHAFRPGAETTLVLRDQHIRFLREARMGAPLRMTGGVIELGETDGRFLMLLHHADGALAATFQIVAAHVDARTGEPRPWPGAARTRAQGLMVQVPHQAAARSCSLEPVEPRASLARALELGLLQTTLGAVQPSECDVFGRMTPDVMLARLIGGAVHLGARRTRRTIDPQAGIGGAAVEYRLVYFGWPTVGERLEVRAGWASVEPKVRRLIYWALDAETGRPWCVAESATVSFDLNTRKMIALEGDALEAARTEVVAGLTL